jgi:hypothetical protein
MVFNYGNHFSPKMTKILLKILIFSPKSSFFIKNDQIFTKILIFLTIFEENFFSFRHFWLKSPKNDHFKLLTKKIVLGLSPPSNMCLICRRSPLEIEPKLYPVNENQRKKLVCEPRG